jgi:O-glycosyl hydrolase
MNMRLKQHKHTLRTGLLLCLLTNFALAQSTPAPIRITLDPEQRFQVIEGFGVNFNGTYFRSAQKAAIDLLINDLGATIFRLDPYGLTNWEAANDNDDPAVMNWEYYNDRYSIPTFEAAWAAGRYLNARGARLYLALSGLPPTWMLDDKAPVPQHKVCYLNNRQAVHLNPAQYEEFAETVVSLALYARTRARLQFDYFGPVNETDCYPAEGPRIDPAEMPKVLQAVARRLQKEGLGDVKLIVAEQAVMENDYLTPLLDAPELVPQIGAFAFHSYASDSLTPHRERLEKSTFSHLPLWLTEYGDLNDKDKTAANEWTGFSLLATERVLTALNQGASAALYWDAFDNYHEHYPRLTFYGLLRNADHAYTPKKRYYAAKQLYRFVRPGAQRIAAQVEGSGVLASAFRSAEGLVVVGAKKGGWARLQLALPATSSPLPLRWELHVTSPQLNCQQVEILSVKNGVAEFTLPGQAVFTLVGKFTP